MLLNEEQAMLRDSARSFCADQAPISQLRRLRDEDAAQGFDRDVWRGMAQLGWAGIPFPEQFGGLAFGYKGLGAVTEETGRTLAASPLFATVWLCGTALDLGGSEAQKAKLLPGICAGERLMALALEESHRHDPYGLASSARAEGDAFILHGAKTFVLDGHVADQLIVAARTSGAPGERDGISLFLVDRGSDGLALTRTRMVDSRNAANLELRGLRVGRDALIGALGGGAQLLDATLDIARIGLAAEMLGGARECFERTLGYLKTREQFGVPIGAFQALQHRAANAFCEIELAQSCVLEALTALDEGRDREEIAKLASLAKAKAGEACGLAAREGIQMHGGIGMTDEFDIGFFLKRAAVCEQTLGDRNFHLDRYAALDGY